MPTLRQERLAEVLADPATKTKRQALLASGYSEKTADRKPGVTVGAVGVRRATEALEARRLDSAPKLRAISEKALRKLDGRLDSDPSDQLVLGAVKVTYDARAAGVDDDAEALSPQDRVAARAMVLRYCRIAARVAVYRAMRSAGVVRGAPEVP